MKAIEAPRAGLRTPLHKPEWKTQRFKYLFSRVSRPVQEGQEVVTAFRDGVVTRRSNRREDGFTFADKEIGYQGIEPGDLAIHAMDGFAGAIGVSDSAGKVSPVLTVLVPKVTDEADARFWAYYLRSLSVSGYIESLAKGIRERSTDFRWKDAGDLLVNHPDLPTQKRIAAFLDRETARIDELIAKKERLMQGFAPRLEALVATALTDRSLPQLRFEHIAQAMSRPCDLSEHDELVRLGLYNRGRGIFKKPAADEEGMGDSTFYFIEDGDLILSGQFAWEGAVAMAGKEEAGCVVSHRYPVYRGTAVKTSYLLAFFRSRYGDFVLNDASRGAAGRNRPLNTRRLGKEKIPVPSESLQDQIEHTIFAEARLRSVHFASIDRLREYRAALITAAVTGQIDVETYGKSGATSATLDRIEAEMQG